MRIGLAYNEKPESAPASDQYAEWDDASTITAVEQALGLFGSVIRLEADAFFPQKLSLALHKGRTKEILAYRGVPTAPFRVIERPSDLERMPLPFPLFVKPVAEGSGKGVFVNNLCDSPGVLAERVLFLLERYAQPVLVETYLPGAEFTVAILGNGDEVRCLPVVGFDFAVLPAGAAPVYGYEAKWVWDTPDRPLDIFQCPADVAPHLYREIEQVALDAYRAIGCRDWCRVDVRVDRFGVPNVIELNPLPGIIPDPAMNSCFPKAARAAGIGYDDLIHDIVQIAWRRVRGRDVSVGAQHAAPLHAHATATA